MNYNLEDLRSLKKLIDKKEKGSGDKRMCFLPLRVSEGTMKIRILPSVVGEKNKQMPGFVYYQHKELPEIGKMTCWETHGIDCPICELLKKYSNKMDIDLWESRIKTAFNVLVLNDEEKDSTLPYVMLGTKGFLDEIMGFIMDDEVGDVTDPYLGLAVSASRLTDFGKLKVTHGINQTPIANNETNIQNILENRYKLHEIWKKPSDKMKEKMQEAVSSLEGEIQRRLSIIKDIENLDDTDTSIENATKPKPTPKTTKTTETTTTKTTITETTKKPKPVEPATASTNGEPDCMGKYKEDDSKCNTCAFEFDCIEVAEAK